MTFHNSLWPLDSFTRKVFRCFAGVRSDLGGMKGNGGGPTSKGSFVRALSLIMPCLWGMPSRMRWTRQVLVWDILDPFSLPFPPLFSHDGWWEKGPGVDTFAGCYSLYKKMSETNIGTQGRSLGARSKSILLPKHISLWVCVCVCLQGGSRWCSIFTPEHSFYSCLWPAPSQQAKKTRTPEEPCLL